MGASAKAGGPDPMTSGATATCSRSTTPASTNLDTVTPPPSISRRLWPRSRSACRMSRGPSSPVGRAGSATTSQAEGSSGVARPSRSRAAGGGAAAVSRRSTTVGAAPSLKTALEALRRPPGSTDHAHRIGTLDLADGQPGVVGGDGARPDHDGVDQRPQAVQAPDVGRPGHVVRVPGRRGDAAVEALTGLRDDQIGVKLERQVQIEHLLRRGSGRGRCFPSAGRIHLQRDGGLGMMMNLDRTVRRRSDGTYEVPCDAFVQRGRFGHGRVGLRTLG